MIVRLAQVLACAFVLFACSSKSASETPKSRPGEPGCGFSTDEKAIVVWTSGTAWAEDLREISAYADGHVEVRRFDTTTQTVLAGTAQVGAARVQKLHDDIEATAVFAESEGCYAPDDLPYDAGGSSLVAQHDGTPRRYSEAGEGPDALFSAMHVSEAFFNEVASVAK